MNNSEFENSFIELRDENNNIINLEVIADTSIAGYKYLLTQGDEGAVILKYIDEDDEDEVFTIVEESDELDAVVKVFEELLDVDITK